MGSIGIGRAGRQRKYIIREIQAQKRNKRKEKKRKEEGDVGASHLATQLAMNKREGKTNKDKSKSPEAKCRKIEIG